MRKPDELERLSRLRDGELTREESEALQKELAEQPELREGLAQLELLDRAARELPASMDPATADRLVRGAMVPVARGPALAWAAGAALVAAAVTAFVVSPGSGSRGEPQSELAVAVAVSGAVSVNGMPVSLSAERALRAGDAVETGESGLAMVTVARGALRLPPRSLLRIGSNRALALERGTLLVSANGLTVSGGGSQVEVHGDAVLSVESSDQMDRVSTAIASSGGQMQRVDWARFAPAAFSAATATELTVFVLAGTAKSTAGESSAVKVVSGQRLQVGEHQPVAVAGASLAGPDLLQARAKRGEFAFRQWRGEPRLPRDLVKELNLSPTEVERVLEASRACIQHQRDRLAEIFVSAGGNARRVAEELTGLRAPSTGPDVSMDVQMFRALAEEEAAYVAALDRIIGGERAEALLSGLGSARYPILIATALSN